MTPEEIEIVARAIEASLFKDNDNHGCRVDGPQDGEHLIAYGHVSLRALSQAAITALDQYREGKARQAQAEADAKLLSPLGLGRNNTTQEVTDAYASDFAARLMPFIASPPSEDPKPSGYNEHLGQVLEEKRQEPKPQTPMTLGPLFK